LTLILLINNIAILGNRFSKIVIITYINYIIKLIVSWNNIVIFNSSQNIINIVKSLL
jgi:hypothetical protein